MACTKWGPQTGLRNPDPHLFPPPGSGFSSGKLINNKRKKAIQLLMNVTLLKSWRYWKMGATPNCIAQLLYMRYWRKTIEKCIKSVENLWLQCPTGWNGGWCNCPNRAKYQDHKQNNFFLKKSSKLYFFSFFEGLKMGPWTNFFPYVLGPKRKIRPTLLHFGWKNLMYPPLAPICHSSSPPFH